VNTVFQHYALFPHRTVAGNVAFGLEMDGCPQAEIPGRVAKALEMVRLPGLGDRRIEQLSGGQKQRVALARAVVLEPEVLLLDEPMAALDLKLRKEMQVEVKNLQERLKITFIFVTHDQDEALTMSDRIAVMNQGRVEQLGAPEELYERPRTRFVADFLAVRNLMEVAVVAVSAGQVSLRTRGGMTLTAADDGGYRVGASVCVGIRPERMSLDAPAGDVNRLTGTLDDEIYLGDRTDWRVRLGDETVTVAEGAATARARKRGQAATVSFPPEAVLRLEDGPGA
jgi:spermidine/putrescine transport system ATP-binding protein